MPPSPARPKAEARLAAERWGRRGEWLAAWYLRLKLYRILARRVKTPVGELDLLAEHFGTLVFIEVKTRLAAAAERDALEAVDRHRIVRAAEYYLARHPRYAAARLRFDVIFLAPHSWPRHVRNAFGG